MNDKAYKFSTRDDTTFRVGDTAPAGGGVLIIGADVDGADITLKNTWQEIYDALAVGTPVFVSVLPQENDAVMFLVNEVVLVEGEYMVILSNGKAATTPTPDGYPSTVITQAIEPGNDIQS